MEDLDLLLDLHLDGARQGPGSLADTRQALALSGLMGQEGLKLADIGCGTGASTLLLAEVLDAEITAVDFLEPFLDRLHASAEKAGLKEKITPLTALMEELPFAPESLDAIWSEGAIYNMGFAHGVRTWSRFLKTGGVLAVSELTWITAERPKEIEDHWAAAYQEVATAAEKIAVLEAAGYSPLGYFVLPTSSWIETYYDPLEARFEAFLTRHDQSAAAKELIDTEMAEIDLYKRYADYVSYGFYIARKVAG